MKLFGHPVHIMLIHFPAALFPMDLVCSGISFFTSDDSFTMASFYAGAGGITVGWLAMIFGTWDLLRLYKTRQDAMSPALIHGGINSIVVIVFTILVFMRYLEFPDIKADRMGIVFLKATCAAMMLFGNFIGGQLILKYKVVE
ncbi:MAG TPA: DUF2231 domain-containing protein [Saprospiraceae bacterium]|nr:DUF2231 domain-containing protein [Saprospiraceae bacterium]